jgi:indolepyruvate ferredoxin oxidoreductase beta subunit
MGEEIHSPMIPKGQADVILAFEPAEAVRSLPYLREGGMLIVNRKAVKPVTATLGGGQYDGHEMLDFLKKKVDNLLIMDGEAVCRQAGSAKVLNVALLGAAAASGALDISIPDMEVEIKKKVKPQFVELNQKALALGAAIAGAQRKADGTKTEVR